MWWSGLRPNHHIHGSLLRAKRFFITLLGARPAGESVPEFPVAEVDPARGCTACSAQKALAQESPRAVRMDAWG
jgi:hypothetical protein